MTLTNMLSRGVLDRYWALRSLYISYVLQIDRGCPHKAIILLCLKKQGWIRRSVNVDVIFRRLNPRGALLLDLPKQSCISFSQVPCEEVTLP